MDRPSLAQEKAEIRRRARRARAALTAEEKRAADGAIRRAVLASAAYAQAKTLFAYVSTEGEPDTRALIEAALRDGKRVYVPKCLGKTMLAVPFPGWDGMETGPLGILEPRAWTETAEAEEIDLTLTPCVTASPDGGRLGHGGGYYDRFFQSGETEKVCLCYEALLTEKVPTAYWDARMDALVTERGWRKCETET